MRKSLFGVYNPAHKFCLLNLDLIGILIAFYIPSRLRLGLAPEYFSFEFFVLAFIIIISLFVGNGYTSSALGGKPRLPLNTFLVVLASAIPATLFIYLLGPERFTYLFGRGIFPSAILLIGIIAMLNRIALNYVFRNNQRERSILVVGDVKSQKHFDNSIHQSISNMRIARCANLLPENNPTLFDAIVIAPDHKLTSQEQQILIDTRLVGIPIFSLSDFFESFLFLVPVSEINNDWFIRAEGFAMLHSTVSTRVKRTVDLAAAISLMFVTVPISLLTAVLIKLVSPGPVLFSQTRVGLQGQHFTLYKFRTMRINSESNGARWAEDNDDRIILFGRFLRATRIDELPQCWNILRGDMSIIGPRPERPEFTEELAREIPYYELRHIIKPGLTGWAQVRYPYGASVEDALRKLQYDLYYIKNYSLLLDLNIMLRTVLVTVGREGR